MKNSQTKKVSVISKIENWSKLPIIVNGIKAYKFFNPDLANRQRS